jgi:hypothetical protein
MKLWKNCWRLNQYAAKHVQPRAFNLDWTAPMLPVLIKIWALFVPCIEFVQYEQGSKPIDNTQPLKAARIIGSRHEAVCETRWSRDASIKS